MNLRTLLLAGVTVAVCLVSTPAAAQFENNCDPGDYPDVIVGSLPAVQRWGTIGGISAYSVATTSCNVGTCWLNWISNTNQHPVIGANMYRLKDGRFEHIGQSWLKHGFFALSEGLCDSGCIGTDGTHLGVRCSDPYSAGLNGSQSGLGPKSDVNPFTGFFNYPFPTQGQGGNSLYKRLQVHNDDLDPALNTGAQYWVGGQYITPDDAAAAQGENNVSYRPVNVGGAAGSGNYPVSVTGSTTRGRSPIFAWRVSLPPGTVRMNKATVPSEGVYWFGNTATDIGGGMWRYEYAVHNVNSHRSARSFSVPIPIGSTVANIGFHDVDYHSGEPYDGTDWSVSVADGYITWSTDEWDDTPGASNNANALRWGTLYNFGFDINVAPNNSATILGLYRPGTEDSVTVSNIRTPGVCDNDGICDLGEDCTNCADDCNDMGGLGGCCGDAVCDPGESDCACRRDCGAPPVTEDVCDDGEDEDCDGLVDCQDADCCPDGVCAGTDDDLDGFALCDCDDSDLLNWHMPGEVEDLLMGKAAPTSATLNWTEPFNPGGDSLTYETLRANSPAAFSFAAECMGDPDPTDTTIEDVLIPAVNSAYYYLVRATNDCPSGDGDLGRTSELIPREALTCP